MDISGELERLEQIYRDGMLSEKEYAAAKNAVIEKLRNVDRGFVQNGRVASDQRRSIAAFIAGLILMLGGLFLTAAFAMQLVSEKPSVPFKENVILLILMGIAPTILGLIMCFRR